MAASDEMFIAGGFFHWIASVSPILSQRNRRYECAAHVHFCVRNKVYMQ